MKIIITLAILASFALNGVAQTNIIQIPVGDLGLVAQGGVKVQVQLLSPLPRIVNGVGVRPDPMAHFTDTNGVAAFTNLVWGNYGAQVFGQPGIPFKFTVQTNTVGTVNVFKLVGFTNIPPAPWPYYTASQIDLFLAGLLTNGQEVVTFGGATFIKTNFDAGQAGTLVSRLPNGNFVVGSSNRLAIVNTNSAFGSNVFCSILGGALNEMIYDGGTPGGADYSVIGGGLQNVNYGSPYSVMAGGRQNLVNNSWEGCVIGGGEGNYVDGSYSLIGGGLNNSVYGSVSCTIGGGASNTIAGSGLLGATIPGGSGNSANGNNSFAAGTGSTAHNNGSFVWSDSQGGAQDTAQDQVVMSAHGGFVFTNGPIRADAAGLYNFPYAIVRYPNGQQLINSSNALYFGDGTLLSTNHTLLGDGSQLAGINGGTITNSLHNCIILVASNSVVSASATASMVSSNLIYLVDTTAGNVLLTLAPVPGSASFSVYNLGTNSVIETNTPAFNFKVAIGTTLIYTNKVIISGYAGKGQTWTGVNSSNLLLTAHFLTTQQLTDMATNAAWAVTNNLQILAAQINGTIAATNLGQLSLTNLPAGVVTNGSASLVMLGSVNVSNTLSAGTLLITNSALFNTDINIAANHSLVWNNQQGILAWNGGLGSLTGTLSGYNAGPYPISTFSVSVTNFNITGNFNAGLVKATNGIVMPTNSAPTGVVWGTTPPDYWLKQYALPASNIVWTPCWTNH